ncbi:hypothetical protein ACQKK5_08160 [Brevibacillus panacihumi]|uniref:hypothetical protein n=1 Tax=Brevibacillus panacihumi TaxID=497735 RepID=UPI003D0751E4
MAQIIRFPNARTTEYFAIADGIRELAEMEATGQAVSFMGAVKLADGSVATVWANADWGERMELIGHLQADVMMSMVEANLE